MNSEINIKFEIDKTTVRLLVALAALIAIIALASRSIAAQEVADTVRINTRVVFMDALVTTCQLSESQIGLPLIDRHIRKIARADVFGARANEFVVGVLFEDVAGPATNSADGENGRVEVERNSHHVVCRG
jgi:hypothetical protein